MEKDGQAAAVRLTDAHEEAVELSRQGVERWSVQPRQTAVEASVCDWMDALSASAEANPDEAAFDLAIAADVLYPDTPLRTIHGLLATATHLLRPQSERGTGRHMLLAFIDRDGHCVTRRFVGVASEHGWRIDKVPDAAPPRHISALGSVLLHLTQENPPTHDRMIEMAARAAGEKVEQDWQQISSTLNSHVGTSIFPGMWDKPVEDSTDEEDREETALPFGHVDDEDDDT